MDFSIAEAMLQVLDRPTELRIIAETKCPLIGGNGKIGDGKIYFMIDHGYPGCGSNGDEDEVFDDWRVSDNAGNEQNFSTNAEMLAFFKDNDEIFENIYVEGF